MTSYLSNQRHQRTWWAAFLHGSKRIFGVYAASIAVYQITGALLAGESTLFDLKIFLHHLVLFDLPAPAYYVAVYLQLMLASRFFYRCIEGFSGRYLLLWEIGGGLVLLMFAAFSVQYTDILGIPLGGGKLFGGTYLFLYYLGMLLMKHRVFECISVKKSLVITVTTSPLLILWLTYIHLTQLRIDSYFPFGSYNPPGVAEMVLAVLMLFWVYGVFTLLQSLPSLHLLTAIVVFIGQHTLYIFLYHWFVLQYFIFRLSYIPFTAVVVLASLTFFPIGWEYIVGAVVRFFRRLQRLDA